LATPSYRSLPLPPNHFSISLFYRYFHLFSFS
jgi:hypothetical protein